MQKTRETSHISRADKMITNGERAEFDAFMSKSTRRIWNVIEAFLLGKGMFLRKAIRRRSFGGRAGTYFPT